MADPRSFWRPGKGINTAEYRFYMAHPVKLREPWPLEGHSMESFSQNLSEALTMTETEWDRGMVVTYQEIARPAEQLSLDITIGFPQGALDTPLMQMAENTGCTGTFYTVYTCPTDKCFAHYWVFPNGRLDPPVPGGGWVTRETHEMIVETSTLHVRNRMKYIHMDGYQLNEFTGDTIYAAQTLEQNCQVCTTCVNDFIVGGINATGNPFIAYSEDRGRTFTEVDFTVTLGATIGQMVTSIASYGDYVVATLADAASPGPGTAGAVAYSHDGGASWTLDANITNAMYASVIYNGTPYVAGQGGEIWRSDFKQAFCEIVHTVTTETLLAATFDKKNNLLYFGGAAGTLINYNGTSVTDLTSSLGIATAILSLNAPSKKYSNWIQVGSTSGGFYESFDQGSTWCTNTVASTTDDITAISGDDERTLVGTDVGDIYIRDLLTSFMFETVDYLYGANPGTAVIGLEQADNQNTYLAGFQGTDAAVMLLRTCAPDRCSEYTLSECSSSAVCS